MATTATTYDEIPYLTKPRLAAHADALATVATLMGMSPAPVTHCRVLEIGCGTGGNLLPMAATLPGSEFIGVDPSAVQIAAARGAAAAAGVTNAAFEARSIADFGPADGRFDYIVCHGVFSWVPEAVQEAILRVCSGNLAPQGVAYVSYNTYPGWHLRRPVRDMMGYHARRAPNVADRVPAARGMLQFLMDHVPDRDGTYARVLREEAEVLANAPDHYLFHEHLEADNQPLYFSEFVGRARAHGLQYLGESGPVRRAEHLSAEARAALEQVAPDLVTMEQYLDFLYNRPFRKTLLCHAAVGLNRAPTAAVLDGLVAVAAARPVPGPGVTGPDVMTFRGADGSEITSNAPPVKAGMAAVAAAWPRAVPVPDLRRAAAALLRGGWEADAARSDQLFAQFLLGGFLSGLVMLHTHRPDFAAEPTGRPAAFRLPRSQAETQGDVSTAFHQQIRLSEAERHVVRRLDGTRDRAALAVALADAVRAGDVPPPADPGGATDRWLDDLLVRLARSGVLEA